MSRLFAQTYVKDNSGASAFSGAGLISGWYITTLSIVKLTSLATEATLLSRWGPGSGQIAYLFTVNPGADQKEQIATHNGFNDDSITNGTTQIPLNQWFWLAATQSQAGENGQRLWINGVLDKQRADASNIGSFGTGNGAPLHIGGRENVGYLQAYVQFAAVWQAELTRDELVAAYNGGIYDRDKILGIQGANLKGAWDMNDIATDLSGRGWPLTNFGTTLSTESPPLPTYGPPMSPPQFGGWGAC